MRSEQRNLYIIDKANAFVIKSNHPPPRCHRREKTVVATRPTFSSITAVSGWALLSHPGWFQQVQLSTLTQGRFQPAQGQNHILQPLVQAGQWERAHRSHPTYSSHGPCWATYRAQEIQSALKRKEVFDLWLFWEGRKGEGNFPAITVFISPCKPVEKKTKCPFLSGFQKRMVILTWKINKGVLSSKYTSGNFFFDYLWKQSLILHAGEHLLRVYGTPSAPLVSAGLTAIGRVGHLQKCYSMTVINFEYCFWCYLHLTLQIICLKLYFTSDQ